MSKKIYGFDIPYKKALPDKVFSIAIFINQF